MNEEYFKRKGKLMQTKETQINGGNCDFIAHQSVEVILQVIPARRGGKR